MNLNESKNGPRAYFPLYNFPVSFINSKLLDLENKVLKPLITFFSGFIMYKSRHMHIMGLNSEFLVILGHPYFQSNRVGSTGEIW